MNPVIFLILLCICCHADNTRAASYAVARSAAPVLNSPAFSAVFGGMDGKTLKTDACRQPRELEFIALPGTVFTIRGTHADGKNKIFRVATEEYPAPANSALYVDSRFVELQDLKPPPRVRQLPPAATIIASLKASVGAPYVWGGNVQDGSGELLELFYRGNTPAAARRQLSLAGLDCSGLLYQATNGWTPRNTSQLISYGRAVQIAGKSVDEIARLLEPLDLIVWNGHVIIVLDRETVIESRLECGREGNGGVMTTALRQRLTGIMRTRRAADQWPATGKQRDIFVVRRWY